MEEINSWYYVYGVFVGLNIMLAIQYNFFLGKKHILDMNFI